MAKIIINIDTLNLNIADVKRGPSLGDLLGAAIHVRSMCSEPPAEADTPAAQDTAGEQDDTPTAAQAPTFDEENVLDFLGSDERYSMRTAASVAKHFGVAQWEASDMLRDLVYADAVRTRTRRSDGITLYSVA